MVIQSNLDKMQHHNDRDAQGQCKTMLSILKYVSCCCLTNYTSRHFPEIEVFWWLWAYRLAMIWSSFSYGFIILVALSRHGQSVQVDKCNKENRLVAE